MAAWRGTMFICVFGEAWLPWPLGTRKCFPESPWLFWFRFRNSSNLPSFNGNQLKRWLPHPDALGVAIPCTLLKTISVHMTRNFWNQNAPTQQLGLSRGVAIHKSWGNIRIGSLPKEVAWHFLSLFACSSLLILQPWMNWTHQQDSNSNLYSVIVYMLNILSISSQQESKKMTPKVREISACFESSQSWKPPKAVAHGTIFQAVHLGLLSSRHLWSNLCVDGIMEMKMMKAAALVQNIRDIKIHVPYIDVMIYRYTHIIASTSSVVFLQFL